MIILFFRFILGRMLGIGGLLLVVLCVVGEVWNGCVEEVIVVLKVMGCFVIVLRVGVNLDMMGGSCGRFVRGFVKNVSLCCCGWWEWNM